MCLGRQQHVPVPLLWHEFRHLPSSSRQQGPHLAASAEILQLEVQQIDLTCRLRSVAPIQPADCLSVDKLGIPYLIAEELSLKPMTELLGCAFRVSLTRLMRVSGTA